jgi:hypothetical protein
MPLRSDEAVLAWDIQLERRHEHEGVVDRVDIVAKNDGCEEAMEGSVMTSDVNNQECDFPAPVLGLE